MKQVFFDTWGWVAIVNRRDIHHREATRFYKRFLKQGGSPITTDYILAETWTLLKVRTNIDGVIQFGEGILRGIRAGKIRLESINEQRRLKAWNLLKKYQDKPEISFSDLSSFVVIRELGITEILTGDEHFEHVGLNVKKLF